MKTITENVYFSCNVMQAGWFAQLLASGPAGFWPVLSNLVYLLTSYVETLWLNAVRLGDDNVYVLYILALMPSDSLATGSPN